MENQNWIKLSLPHKSGTEMKWVEEAFREDWFVPLGPNVDEFEIRLAQFLDTDKPVVALSAGTAAIHLGLVMLGIEAGDEVLCQDLTFSASANPIRYQGGVPIFIGSEKYTYNMSAEVLEQAITERIKATGHKPKAVICVDLYGTPANYGKILPVCQKYDIPLLEDSAEAMGSEYNGVKCGLFGKYGILSFNGNKLITTSGGGALICPDAESAKRVKFLATQARENKPYYYHKVIGYNYRLSNVSAGIGIGQLDTVNERLERRRRNHRLYAEAFAGNEFVTVHSAPAENYNPNFWLTTIILADSSPLSPDELRIKLLEHKIETRLLWRPMHMQPVFAGCPYYGDNTGEMLFNNGLCLPSGSTLTDNDIERVIESIKHELSI